VHVFVLVLVVGMGVVVTMLVTMAVGSAVLMHVPVLVAVFMIVGVEGVALDAGFAGTAAAGGTHGRYSFDFLNSVGRVDEERAS